MRRRRLVLMGGTVARGRSGAVEVARGGSPRMGIGRSPMTTTEYRQFIGGEWTGASGG
jgi:hypothetical protein